jgi:hypothetical protein
MCVFLLVDTAFLRPQISQPRPRRPLCSKRVIDIPFNLSVDFETADVAALSESLTSASGTADVSTYIKACKCDNLDSYNCNTSPHSPDTILYLCITSIDPDVEINYIESLGIIKRNALGDETLEVVAFTAIQNNDTSSMTEKNATAVGIAMIVPTRFFSYSEISSIEVSGIADMKLVGSRRLIDKLAHDASHISRDMSYSRMTRGEETETPFVFSIQMEPESAIPDEEWSTTHVGSGSTINVFGIAYSFIGAATYYFWASFM